MSAESIPLFEKALALHKQGDAAAAIPLYREAIERGPIFADLLIGAGLAMVDAGLPDEAIEHLRRAAGISPENGTIFSHLGSILIDSGRHREAALALEQAAGLLPEDASILTNLGCAYRSLGRVEEALDSFERATRLDPTTPQIHSNLATALATLNRPAEAALRLYAAIVLSPDYAGSYSNLGAVMLRGNMPDSRPIMYMLRRAVQIDPDLPTAHSNLSVILAGRGEPDIAVPHNLRAAELAPSPEHWSRVLFNLNYCDSWSAEACAREHRRLGALFDAAGEPLRLPPSPARPAGRHRIGFCSPDFRNHSVAYFLRPLLAALDRSQFEIFCYSDVLKGDEVTAEIRAAADHWIEAVGLSDLELAHQVRVDRVDTLIDLAGHTPANRMGAFALRPAPVQMTWLGYANTSGLSTVNYRIVDEITDPPGAADALASETLLRLPGGFLCYGPPPYAPPPAFREPAADGAVIFGTFNNPTKITDATFTLWARLLLRVPKSRLLIKSFRLRDEVLRLHIVGKFTERGVSGDRLILLDANSDAVEHLATYGHIDIGLDPVLYNGTTTTFEAMWMGVPVIAERGDRHAARVGASLLTHIGLPELIAENAEDYIEIACRLAEDPAELARVRSGLREKLARSPLCDAAGFARKFERALLEAAGAPIKAPVSALDTLKRLLEQTPPPLDSIAQLRDALAEAVLGAVVPSSEAALLIPVCASLTRLGLRQSEFMLRLDGPPTISQTLAFCLKAPAYRLPALPPLDRMAPAEAAPLAALLLEEPLFWSQPGESARYLTHVETVLSLMRRGLTGQDPSAGAAALAVTSACRLGAAVASGRSLTQAARDRAALIEMWLSAQGLPLDYDFPAAERERPRFGVFRAGWEPGADTALALGYLEDLTVQGETILYTTRPLGESELERRAQATADRVVLLPDPIPDAVAALRADDLDLLLIGHDVATHMSLPAVLSAFRLARRQAVTGATPVQPGFARLDAWLVEDDTPPLDWVPEGALPVRLGRAELGVAENALALACGAPLGRLTAELLAAWGAILKEEPGAHLLLYPFDPGWAGAPGLAAAEQRLRVLLAAGGADLARVTILPPGVSKAGARAVLALADLYLDTFPASEPVDLLDPLAVDLPLLLYRGEEPSCRRNSRIHERFGLPALVAGSPEEYVAKALTLIRSPTELADLRIRAPESRERFRNRDTLISWRLFQARVAPSNQGPSQDR